MLERGANVVELTAEAATICTRTGGLMRFYKSQGNTEAVLPWCAREPSAPDANCRRRPK